MGSNNDGNRVVPEIRVKEINVDVFLRLCASHSRLAQMEYNVDRGYNNTRESYAVEMQVIEELARLGLIDELMGLI